MASAAKKNQFDTRELAQALRDWLDEKGRGAQIKAARLTGLSASTILYIKDDRIETISPKTWDALYDGIGPPIPPPPWRQERPDMISSNSKWANMGGEVAKVPIFALGMGEPRAILDRGEPAGTPEDTMLLPVALLPNNAYLVHVDDDHMMPSIAPGDYALVAPGRPLAEGKLCFAAWPNGERQVRRYRLSGDTVLLESDNRDHAPIIVGPESNNVRLFRVLRLIKNDV